MFGLRLHKSSIVVGLLTLAVMTLIVVPGMDHKPRQLGILSATVAHGWPLTYLERDPLWNPRASRGVWGVPWLKADAWNFFGSQRWSYDWVAAYVDLGAAVLIIAAVVGFTERRNRRQRHVWQFRVSELFALTTAAALLVGWYAFHRDEWRRESPHKEAVEKSIAPAIGDGRGPVSAECVAPLWLQRLVGVELLPRCLWRFMALETELTANSEQEFDMALPDIIGLRHIRMIRFASTDDESRTLPWDVLAKIPQLRTLELEYLNGCCGDPSHTLDADEANHLAVLQQLTELRAPQRSNLTDGAIEVIRRRMPHCRVVYEWDD